MPRRDYDKVTVTCAKCGKRLVGHRMMRYNAITVRKHKMPNGWTCMGHLTTTHSIVKEEPT